MTEDDSRYGVICAWDDEVLSSENYLYPATKPNGYRELDEAEY